MEQFMEFLADNMYVSAFVLYILGMFLKKIPKIPNWTIPFILSGIGIALGILMIGVPTGTVESYVNGSIQGVLAAGAAVLVNQSYQQILGVVKKATNNK